MILLCNFFRYGISPKVSFASCGLLRIVLLELFIVLERLEMSPTFLRSYIWHLVKGRLHSMSFCFSINVFIILPLHAHVQNLPFVSHPGTLFLCSKVNDQGWYQSFCLLWTKAFEFIECLILCNCESKRPGTSTEICFSWTGMLFIIRFSCKFCIFVTLFSQSICARLFVVVRQRWKLGCINFLSIWYLFARCLILCVAPSFIFHTWWS